MCSSCILRVKEYEAEWATNISHHMHSPPNNAGMRHAVLLKMCHAACNETRRRGCSHSKCWIIAIPCELSIIWYYSGTDETVGLSCVATNMDWFILLRPKPLIIKKHLLKTVFHFTFRLGPKQWTRSSTGNIIGFVSSLLSGNCFCCLNIHSFPRQTSMQTIRKTGCSQDRWNCVIKSKNSNERVFPGKNIFLHSNSDLKPPVVAIETVHWLHSSFECIFESAKSDLNDLT